MFNVDTEIVDGINYHIILFVEWTTDANVLAVAYSYTVIPLMRYSGIDRC